MKRRLMTTLVLLALSATSGGAQVWTQRADLPGVGRHHPVTFVLDGMGYAATGTMVGASVSDDFYRYDPVNNTWQVLPDFPGTDRSYAYGGSYNGKGYLGFGLGGGYLADLWQFDPVTGLWTQLASCPGGGRMHPAFVITDDGRIYVGMGNGPAGNLRDWWEYTIATNTWTRRADLPGPARHHPYYFNVGNVPYVGFGHGTSEFRDVYRFDPVTLTWARLADFPGSGRLAGTQFPYGGRGYILSGEGPGEVMLPTGEFWAYHPADDTWFQLPSHPGSGRWAPGSFVIGDKAYVMAGQSTSRLERDMWMFDMTTSTDVTETPIVAPRSMVPYPNPVAGGEVRLLGSAGTAGIATVSLLAADGRHVAFLRRRDTTVELPAGLAPGQYYLAFGAGGRIVATRKITVLR